MSDEAYVSIHGTELTLLVEIEGVSPSGGEKKIDTFSQSGMDYSTVAENGREAISYSFTMLSNLRSDIERARQEVNICPPGAEFSPFTEDQVGYVEQAYATPAKSLITWEGQYYYSEATVICRGPYLYGTEGGIAFQRNVPLPATATITNNGYYPSGIDSMIMGGSYSAIGGDNWAAGLYLDIDGATFDLCDLLMGGDRFILDRFGNCIHSYETEFKKLYTEMQNDLHGSTFFDYGTSGHVLENDCFIGPSGKMYVSFPGPLLSCSPPKMEIEVSSLSGFPEIEIAYISDLSDSEGIDFDLKVGKNIIYFPEDSISNDFIAIGITTDASSNLTMSSFKAEIERYANINDLPTIDPEESATLTVGDGTNSNHVLDYLVATYRDIY